MESSFSDLVCRLVFFDDLALEKELRHGISLPSSTALFLINLPAPIALNC